MKNFLVLSLTLSVIILFANACKKTPKTDENELITDVVLELFAPTDTVYASFKDPDGAGGVAPTIDTLFLEPFTAYQSIIHVENRSVSPAENISEEIKEEGVDHQFFFTISGLNATYSYNDSDINGDPIGLEGAMQTLSTSTGTFHVILKHQPETKDGNSATGSTDIDILFPAQIR